MFVAQTFNKTEHSWLFKSLAQGFKKPSDAANIELKMKLTPIPIKKNSLQSVHLFKSAEIH